MKQAVAKKWVEALLSGEYKQGKKRLQDGDGYCCLGVCKIAKKEGIKVATFRKDIVGRTLEEQCEVAEWAGIRSGEGYKLNKNGKRSLRAPYSLAALNDNGKTFEEIAEVIKKDWEKL